MISMDESKENRLADVCTNVSIRLDWSIEVSKVSEEKAPVGDLLVEWIPEEVSQDDKRCYGKCRLDRSIQECHLTEYCYQDHNYQQT